LDLSGLGSTRGARAVRFIEGLSVPKGQGARARLRLRPWQKKIIRKVLAPGIRTAVVAIPRGNGKSTLAAALGLWALVDGPEGAQVPIVGGVSERQSRICFDTARRMVELSLELVDRVQVFQDKLYMPHHDATLYPLPADADAILGANPTMTLVDELGVVDVDVFEAMRLASGKRAESTLLAIGTPPTDPDSIMRTLVEHGRTEDDPTFALVEYRAPDGCTVDDREAWKVANPALGDFLYDDGMQTEARTVRESAFRQFRLGQWPTGPEGAWMDPTLWASRCSSRTIPDGGRRRARPRRVVLAGLDRPRRVRTRRRATSRCGRAVGEPNPADENYRVDVLDVEDAIRDACRRWRVLEVTADPFRWQRSLAVLQDERIPVSEYPQSPSRMTPACSAFYEAVIEGTLTHSGDQRLARHISNAVLRTDSRGARIVKESKHSKRRIDLAVAAVMAHSRAADLARRPAPSIYVG
jgi:phage terminase large subunit-like protein